MDQRGKCCGLELWIVDVIVDCGREVWTRAVDLSCGRAVVEVAVGAGEAWMNEREREREEQWRRPVCYKGCNRET